MDEGLTTEPEPQEQFPVPYPPDSKVRLTIIMPRAELKSFLFLMPDGVFEFLQVETCFDSD